MLFGIKKPADPNAPAPGADDIIFDVTTATFEAAVLKASMTTPILVDFWAPWCGPCKQFTPILEEAVRNAKGAVKLAKIDIDANPELAQAFRVQSIPFVVAMFQGQPVTAFSGAQPPSQIASLVTQLAKMAGGGAGGGAALDIPALLEDAAAFLAQGDLATAQNHYTAILQVAADNAAAYAGLVRVFIAAGQMDAAQGLIDTAPDTLKNHADLLAAASALRLAQNAPGTAETDALRARIARDADDHDARIGLAKALFAQGSREDAIDALIESIKRNRAFDEGRARTQLLEMFDAIGPDDPVTMAGRRKLSAVLFS